MSLESLVGQPATRYLSYLLRLWRENDKDQPCWCISLESTQDGDRRFFAGLDDMVVFLRQETGDWSSQKSVYKSINQTKEEQSMYARVVTVNIQPDKIEEAIRIFRDDINPVAKEQKGVAEGYFLTDRETGRALSISLWETEADMLAGEENEYLQQQVAKVAYLLTAHPVTEHFEVSVK